MVEEEVSPDDFIRYADIHYADIGDIRISDRQREEFAPAWLADLAESIRAVGLLHPPVTRDGSTLVAGERRIRAVRSIYALGERIRFGGEWVPLGQIPFIDIGDLSPAEAYRAELDENVRRADLTWQERAAATLRLAELLPSRDREIDDGIRGGVIARPHTPDIGAAQALAVDLVGTPGVASDVPHARQEIFRRIQLARAIASGDDAVAGAKTEADGFKLLRRAGLARENLARTAEHLGTGAEDRLRAYHTRAEDWIRDNPLERFDVLITDPPYGMEAESFGDGGGKMVAIEHDYADGEVQFLDSLNLLASATQLMKTDAHAYVYCDIDNFTRLREAFRAMGWRPFRTPLIHLKRQGGRVPWPEQGPRRAYELVMFAVRGGKPVVNIVPDVFDTSLSEGNLGHGAQKPVEGYVNLLRRSIRPGDSILDPYAGTGTVFAAAEQLNVRAVGLERNPETFGIILKRLEELRTARTK